MANWYATHFETKDKNIVEQIANNCMHFDYDEESGCGNCDLAWGLIAIDPDIIEDIAQKNRSSFFIRTSDVLTGRVQTWIYENGEQKFYENKKVECDYGI